MAFNKTNPLMKILALLLTVIISILLLSAIFSGHEAKPETPHKSSVMNDSAISDTPVETLKTLTAEISSVEQQNQKLVTQNKLLTDQNKTAFEQFKRDVLFDVQKQLAEQKSSAATTQAISTTHSENANAVASDYVIHSGDDSTHMDNFTWVSDLQAPPLAFKNKKKVDFAALAPVSADKAADNNKFDTPNSHVDVSTRKGSAKITPIPYYTIPVNATLTGAIAMQPLIGRIPIDGKVPDPYTFKAIIGAKNLAANGVDIPADIQGIVISGIAEGDMLGSCARGIVTAMTFVFQDGRISTTEAKDGQNLGTIAAANGNPCIVGSFHTDAALYLGAHAALAGLQGYGNALSQSQMNNSVSTTTGASISTLIGSANKYAFGQGFAASSQAAQHWWDQRVQNSFDFIFVPNIDPKTGEKLELNINVTQEIAIDYDPKGRKVAYDHASNLSKNVLD